MADHKLSAAPFTSLSFNWEDILSAFITTATSMPSWGLPFVAFAYVVVFFYLTFGCYTLDVIAGTGFSLETNSLEDDGNAFLAAVSTFFSANIQRLPIIVASIFPALEPVMMQLGFRSTGSSARRSIEFISQTLRQLKDDRTQCQQKDRVDLLQLMVDSEASEKFIKDHPNDRYLSAEEILAQGLILFVAGYETTASLLHYMSYCLAMHPDVQDKLHDEIVASLEDEQPTYDNVSKISYLDSCIFESLRLFPPVPTISGLAAETCCVEGRTIHAGEGVMVSTYTVGRDPDLYPQPDTFNPDRFEEGGCSSHVLTLMKELPFGCGPRQCIGMRLALYEAKMAMAAVVRKVRFLRIPETPARIVLKTGPRMSTPETLILVGLELRQ